jgi:hypothetical protein
MLLRKQAFFASTVFFLIFFPFLISVRSSQTPSSFCTCLIIILYPNIYSCTIDSAMNRPCDESIHNKLCFDESFLTQLNLSEIKRLMNINNNKKIGTLISKCILYVSHSYLKFPLITCFQESFNIHSANLKPSI